MAIQRGRATRTLRSRLLPAVCQVWLASAPAALLAGDCDHVVAVPNGGVAPIRVDGATLNNGGPVSPGTRVCVRAGTYDRGKLEFINFVGTETAPILITNDQGLVLVLHGRVYLDDSAHVEFAGDGDPGYEYGFRIVGPAEQAFGMRQRSASAPQLRNLHAHHVEIDYADRHGVQAVGVRGFEKLPEPMPIVDIELDHFYIHRGVSPGHRR